MHISEFTCLRRAAIAAPLLATLGVAGAVVIGSAVVRVSEQEQQPPAQTQQPQQSTGNDLSSLGPKLIAGLKATPGCLGVDVGQMMSGKNVIFAWFENKAAARRWYYSDVHMGMADAFFPPQVREQVGGGREIMEGVPDDVPLLVIASLTPSAQADLKETAMPISQIAIEIYAPMNGGLHLGSRFAPDAVKVPGMKDYTPQSAR